MDAEPHLTAQEWRPAMLVMSRRKDEKIVFPGLGITVTLLNVKGNTARIGIDAPREITILRDELAIRESPSTFAYTNDLVAIFVGQFTCQRRRECRIPAK